jgi:hypothetical protein
MIAAARSFPSHCETYFWKDERLLFLMPAHLLCSAALVVRRRFVAFRLIYLRIVGPTLVRIASSIPRLNLQSFVARRRRGFLPLMISRIARSWFKRARFGSVLGEVLH